MAGQDIERKNGREVIIRLIVVAFALTLASSAQALPPVSFHQADKLVIPVRAACGAGMHSVNGVCVRTPARRGASRCVREKLANQELYGAFRRSVLRSCSIRSLSANCVRTADEALAMYASQDGHRSDDADRS